MLSWWTFHSLTDVPIRKYQNKFCSRLLGVSFHWVLLKIRKDKLYAVGSSSVTEAESPSRVLRKRADPSETKLNFKFEKNQKHPEELYSEIQLPNFGFGRFNLFSNKLVGFPQVRVQGGHLVSQAGL